MRFEAHPWEKRESRGAGPGAVFLGGGSAEAPKWALQLLERVWLPRLWFPFLITLPSRPDGAPLPRPPAPFPGRLLSPRLVLL